MARISQDEAGCGGISIDEDGGYLFQNEAPSNRQTRRREGWEAKRASNTSKRRLMRKSYGRHLRRCRRRRQRRSQRADLGASKLQSPSLSAPSLGGTGRPRRGKKRPPGGRLNCDTEWCPGLRRKRNILVYAGERLSPIAPESKSMQSQKRRAAVQERLMM